MTDDSRAEIRNDPRVVRGWALYDWANSAYFTTTAVALLPTYFASVVVGEDGVSLFGRTYAAESVWALAASAGAFVLLIAAPILGAVADFSGRKKAFLTAFAVTGALCATALSVVGEGDVALTLTLFLAAQSCFAVANVFYDGFLPDITTPETIDRVSAKGFAYGYLGGGLQFAIAVALLALHEPLGISTGAAIRVAIAMAGVWWLGFTVVALRSFREARRPTGAPAAPGLLAYPRIGLWRVLATIRQVGRMPHLLLFVLAYVIYNDGVQTVFVVAAVFGTETLELSAQVIALTILVVQLVAFAGAHLFAHLAGCIGPQRTLLVTLVIWTAIAISASLLQTGVPWQFFAVGGVVGLVQGGTQSLSRSLYASMIPEAASAEMFAFYSLFSKLSAIGGPLLFALVAEGTGSSRAAILAMSAFFVIGGPILALVDVRKARAQRDRWARELESTS